MGSERFVPRPFAVEVRRLRVPGDDCAVAILDLHGEVDSFANPALQEGFASALACQAGGPCSILLNFGDVDYINSTGIALIVGLLTEARRNSVPLVSFGLSEHYLEIFRVTRLSDFMVLAKDETSALGAIPR